MGLTQCRARQRIAAFIPVRCATRNRNGRHSLKAVAQSVEQLRVTAVSRSQLETSHLGGGRGFKARLFSSAKRLKRYEKRGPERLETAASGFFIPLDRIPAPA